MKNKTYCHEFPLDTLMNPKLPRYFLKRIQRQSNGFHFSIEALNILKLIIFPISHRILFQISVQNTLLNFIPKKQCLYKGR